MPIKKNKTPLTFVTDPKIREIIKAFIYVDEHWEQFTSFIGDSAEMKLFTHTLKQLVWLRDNKYISKDFKRAASVEIDRLQRECINCGKIPRTKKSNHQAIELAESIDADAATTKLSFYLLENFGVDSIMPNGKAADYPLNCLIVTLIEYGKKRYPGALWYSDLAKKFNSSMFKMSGWKQNNRARKVIEDRYSSMEQKIDRTKLSEEILGYFTPSE